ncbi:MAG: hypothetical protein IPN65_03455 [Elusimicrobia bacterium]|nr:hypothetical protein [Elusimicrobiota bacterium]MBK7545453.1 hypothetical protein [Elusimicrobiota bacterium]MBK7575531.1 hypothetical protein [Elusimicrobiota bacterium]MBK8127147.1 hypothetical protein [Elusimicrobiota bacterium]MBK8424222.1 hypothetical protein [Elusimicrobiota bacterium]
MIKKILITILLFLSPNFSQAIMLRPKDYKRMSVDEIRKFFLQRTPIGSTRKDVEHFIQQELHKKFKVHNFAIGLKPGSYAVPIEDGDFTMEAPLTSYGFVKHLFLGEHLVDGFWLFTKEGILKDFQVLRHWDGV